MNQPAFKDPLALPDAPPPLPGAPSDDAPNSESHKSNTRHIEDKLQNYASEHIFFGEAELLNNRFELDISTPLGKFSKPHASAFSVKDREKPERACIGYVTEAHHPYRHHTLEALKEHTHPHLMQVLDAGVVYIAAERCNRFVIIFEQPQGFTLQILLDNKDYFTQSEVLKKLVTPIASVIAMLHKLELNHGHINPDNIYIHGDTVMVGECITRPSGSAQPLLYEPIEHITAMPEARGDGNITTDIYALAMLTLDAIGGLEGKHSVTRPQLTALLLSRGAYISLVNESTITNSQLIDLFRGALVESMYERWMPATLLEYIGGKRFNLIPPSPPRESPRAHHFNGADFYTRRSLANALRTHWDKAAAHIRENKIPKWLDSMSYKDGASDRVERSMSRGGGTGSTSASALANEMISRVITILDPQGPIRFKEFRAQPDMLPLMLCHIVESGDMSMRGLFNEALRCDLPAFWYDSQPIKPSTVNPKLGWDVGGVRQLSNMQTIGFGIERLLYEMNPSLPCLSKDYLPYHIISPKVMLKTLDALAKDHAGKRNFVDRHLIAFIAAKTGIRKEAKIREHKLYPKLYNDSEMQAMVMLARAQDKLKLGKLPGLTYWAGLRITEMIEEIHSSEMRRMFSRDLQAVLPEGRLSLVINVLKNKDYLARDFKGHHKAREQYHKNTRQISKLMDKDKLRERARNNGLRLACYISLFILFSVLYYLLHKYTF